MLRALRRLPLLVLALVVTAAAPAVARADDVAEARTRLQTGITAVIETLYPNGADQVDPAYDPAKLEAVLREYFDFAATTRLSVGPAWRGFTPEQQARATELFSRLVIRTYSARVKGSTVRPVVTYLPGASPRPGRVELPTDTTNSGATYRVAYRMEKKDTTWRVYDVVIEGVSLVANYRGQFEAIAQKEGAAGILRVLEAKLAAVDAETAAATP